MPPVPELMSMPARCLRDAGRLAFLALVVVPIYLLLNQYWQSVVRLLVLYAVLALFCLRLGQLMGRVMRYLPAEIPPWQADPPPTPAALWQQTHFGAAEAIRSVRQDPRYLQEVLKPRLQRLLVYRLTGATDLPLEALDATILERIEPALLDFLQREEDTGLWARYRYRRQRVNDVLATLKRLEVL